MIFTCDRIPPGAAEAFRLLNARGAESAFRTLPETCQIRFVQLPGEAEGYRAAKFGQTVTVTAALTREFIAAAGFLLRRMRRLDACGEDFSDFEIFDEPRFPLRQHYLPGHFGNSFEVAGEREMERYLEDMALSGANGYAEWFDTNDMTDPYEPLSYGSINFSMSLWRRKKRGLLYAKKLGLDVSLCITHNVVFTNQLDPALRGVRNPQYHVQGQVLCTSNPAAREVCFHNYRNLFSDLRDTGVEVDKLFFAPYDDGGCACERCQPGYYAKFLGMVNEIYTIAAGYFPKIGADICGWWTSPEEFSQLQAFAASRSWLKTFQYSVTYGVMAVPADIRDTVGRLGLSTFVHIAFSHVMDDRYMAGGFHAAPHRLRAILGSFEQAGCLGMNTYNEGFGDHLNVVLSSLLARNPDADTDAAIEDYCMEYYGLGADDARAVREVICEIQYLDASRAQGELDVLKAVRPRVRVPLLQPWIFEHLYRKAELMALDFRIGAGGWQSAAEMAPVLPQIEERILKTELLFRQVYGMGVPRAVFVEEWHYPKWYRDYKRLKGIHDGRIVPSVYKSKDA